MSPNPDLLLRDPGIDHERALAETGQRYLIGIDEVGRGAVAGPVCVGAVAVDLHALTLLEGVRDSKLLTPAQRETLVPAIRSWGTACAVGEASPDEIDAFGITTALRLAGRRAIAELELPDPAGTVSDSCSILLDGSHDWLSDPAADLFTVDAGTLTGMPGLPPYPVRTLIKGDRSVLTIAAASVLAKVYRDGIMVGLHDEHPQYEWVRNMGYKTAAHSRAIAAHGLCRYHRRSWRIQGVQP